MSRYCVNISQTNDRVMSILGYELVEEGEEFRIYRNEDGADFIVEIEHPWLYVENTRDVIFMSAKNVVALPD